MPKKQVTPEKIDDRILISAAKAIGHAAGKVARLAGSYARSAGASEISKDREADQKEQALATAWGEEDSAEKFGQGIVPEERDMIWLHEHNPDYPDPSNPTWWRWWLLLRWPSSGRRHWRGSSRGSSNLVVFR